MQVALSGPLRAAVDNQASIELEAGTIRELIHALVTRYPGAQRLVDEGLAVSINGEIYRDVRDINIPPDAEVFLLPRIAGG